MYQLTGDQGRFNGDLLRAPFTFDEATMTAEVGDAEQVVGRSGLRHHSSYQRGLPTLKERETLKRRVKYLR